MECLQGSLNQDNLCEQIIVKPPKPVCSPGFHESDGLCIQRRQTPCEEDVDTEAASFSTKSSLSVGTKQEQVPRFHSKVSTSNTLLPTDGWATHELEKKSSRWERLRQHFDSRLVFPHEAAAPHPRVAELPIGTQDKRSDAGIETAFDFGMDPSPLATSYGDSENHSSHPGITEGSADDPSQYFFPRAFRRRRLRIIEPRDDLYFRSAHGGSTDDMRQPKSSGNSEAESFPAEIQSQEEQATSGKTSARAYFGMPLINSVGRPYVGPTTIMDPMNQKLLHPLALQSGLGMKPSKLHTVWHDNRFDSQIGSQRGPFARQQYNTANAHAGNSRGPRRLQQQRSALQKLSSSLSKRSANASATDAVAAQRLNSTAALPQERTTVLVEHNLRGDPNGTTVKTLTANFEGGKAKLLHDSHNLLANKTQQDIVFGANPPTVARTFNEAHAQTGRMLRGRRNRRLEGLDYIPGCWEVCLSVCSRK